jgi:phosphoglycolate phosphatase
MTNLPGGRRYQAVLFDLDGTLLDTLEDLATAANRALAGRSLPGHPQSAYRHFVGDGLRSLVERILPEPQRGAEEVQATMAAFEQEYARNWNERTAPYPGIAPMLDRLTEAGLRLAILSNKPDEFTRLCVERLLPNWTFAPLFGQRPGMPKKPDPTAALAIAMHLRLDPTAVLYVGDTATDMRTAQAAGMDSVGVLWGFRSGEELRQAGARWLIAEPDELLSILALQAST